MAEKMSYNQLRVRLQQGLDQLLSVLPEGDEPVLDCEYRDQQGHPLGKFVPDYLRHNIILLRDFSRMTAALLGGHSEASASRIMGDFGHGTQFVLIEMTEAFAQNFLD